MSPSLSQDDTLTPGGGNCVMRVEMLEPLNPKFHSASVFRRPLPDGEAKVRGVAIDCGDLACCAIGLVVRGTSC